MGLFGGMLRAAVHITEAAVKAPVSIVADVVTLGGTATDKRSPYSVQVLKDLKKNLENDAEEM